MTDLQWNRAFALEQVGEDEEILSELLGLLKDTAHNDLDKLKAGSEAGDATAMGDAAHSIKGACANLGVDGLRELAYELEKAGRGGDLDVAQSMIPELEGMINQLSLLK